MTSSFLMCVWTENCRWKGAPPAPPKLTPPIDVIDTRKNKIVIELVREYELLEARFEL